MQTTPTPTFKYSSSFDEINGIIHIHCRSTEMLCRVKMSSYKVGMNQIL